MHLRPLFPIDTTFGGNLFERYDIPFTVGESKRTSWEDSPAQKRKFYRLSSPYGNLSLTVTLSLPTIMSMYHYPGPYTQTADYAHQAFASWYNYAAYQAAARPPPPPTPTVQPSTSTFSTYNPNYVRDSTSRGSRGRSQHKGLFTKECQFVREASPHVLPALQSMSCPRVRCPIATHFGVQCT